jgi:hypothetical protein
MSDRIVHPDSSVGALFASLVVRERGTVGSLLPRLPTMFEAAPVGDAPEPAAADEVVVPIRLAPPGPAASPVAATGQWPDTSAPSHGEELVRDRQTVVHVERQVLVEASTPGDHDGDEVVAPFRPAPPDPAASPVAAAGQWPDTSAPSHGEELVRDRQTVVHVERQVLVEASTPGDHDGDEVVAPFRPAPPDPAASPVTGAGPLPDTSAPSHTDDEPVRNRQEVVRVERQVRVEASRASTPGHYDDRGAPQPGPAASEEDTPHAHERRPSAEDGTPPELRRAVRPTDEGPAPRPRSIEFTVPESEWPVGQAERHQGGFPVIATRREGLVPRPEQAVGTPELSRPAESVVRVSIGRLEIRAVSDPAPTRISRRERRTQSLDDYLERRNQGSRS